jgi:hypothetical protein
VISPKKMGVTLKNIQLNRSQKVGQIRSNFRSRLTACDFRNIAYRQSKARKQGRKCDSAYQEPIKVKIPENNARKQKWSF